MPTLTHAVAILLIVCAAAATGAEPKAAPAAPAAPATSTSDAAPTMAVAAFSFQLDSINFNSAVFFAQGNLAGGSGRERGTFSFTIRNGNPTPALSIQSVVIQSALTDGGENLVEAPLTSNPNAARQAFRFAHSNAVETKQLNGVGTIKVPHKEAMTLTITGVVRVLYETKPVPPLDLSPASAWVGKKQDVPGCKNGFVLESLKPLKYRCDQAIFQNGLLKDLAFNDKDGKRLPIFAMNASSDQDTQEILCNQPLPEDASISLVICGDPHVISVPFTFTNIPLHPTRTLEHPPQPQAPAKP